MRKTVESGLRSGQIRQTPFPATLIRLDRLHREPRLTNTRDMFSARRQFVEDTKALKIVIGSSKNFLELYWGFYRSSVEEGSLIMGTE
jgi:hypothetical protein